MQRDAKAFLWDVARAAQDIRLFAGNLSLEEYLGSALVRAAVERKFEIIGEALNGLAKSHPEVAKRIGDIRYIIAFRNILIHGYATIDDRRVYDTVQRQVPDLELTVSDLLSDLQRDAVKR
jgi:uncharacterized protein with HEPN domain